MLLIWNKTDSIFKTRSSQRVVSDTEKTVLELPRPQSSAPKKIHYKLIKPAKVEAQGMLGRIGEAEHSLPIFRQSRTQSPLAFWSAGGRQ